MNYLKMNRGLYTISGLPASSKIGLIEPNRFEQGLYRRKRVLIGLVIVVLLVIGGCAQGTAANEDIDIMANLVYYQPDSALIQGAQKLIDAGFKSVNRLKGNYAAWVETGYPIEK